MQAEIRGYFEAEAQELIDRLTSGAQRLADAYAPAEEESIRAMLRAAHTLKGAAHVVGEGAMAALAHAFEEVLAAYRKGQTADARAALLGLTDELALALKSTATADEPADENDAGTEAGEPANQAAAVSTPVGDPPARAESLPRTPRVDAAETAQLLEAAMASNGLAHSMRAALERLDALDDTGTAEFRRLRRKQLRRDLHDDLERLERRLGALFTHASQLQLAPAESLLLEAGRVVRSTAAQLGRVAQCVTHGGQLRLHVPLLDGLRDAMLHLVRNALAHGVEDRAERVRAGKPAVATITVSLERQDGDMVLTCADDGRGIALNAVRAAAIQTGELSAAEAAAATPEQLLAVLLRPGFSLSGKVDEVSGRGVGLDAVRAAAERLGGRVEITSEQGVGACFRVMVPQHQFAVMVLEVAAAGGRHLVPLSAIAQTFKLQPHHTVQLQGMQTLLVEGEAMPFLALDDLLATPHARESRGLRSVAARPSLGVLVRCGRERALLGVEAIGSLREALVQPLPAWAKAEPYVTGIAIASDGTPELVLDPEAMSGQKMGRAHHDDAARAPEVPVLPLLVIDDSLTTRMLEQSILEAEGYEVRVATSAEQGLTMARAGAYALFLVDVEMPGMNGYEFVTTVNADEVLSSTPCIMVTSLDSAESRERGRLAGAYSYIVKGEFNQGIYLERIRSAVAQGTQARRQQVELNNKEGRPA